MLVISRRPDQSIVLPDLGIVFRLLRVNGSVARVGVEAPPEVQVLRDELFCGPARPPELARRAGHELCNRLSKLTMSLHLFEKLWHAGRTDEAIANLENATRALGEMDRDWVMRQFAPPAKTPRCRTLVVEDDPNERELLAGILGMNGCECATAADGQDALDYLSRHDRPDVVLLDMGMPRCDGPQAVRAIRAEPRLSGLKVFSVSPTPPEELGIARGAGGVDAWFPKPLNPRTLWEAIQQALRAPAGN